MYPPGCESTLYHKIGKLSRGTHKIQPFFVSVMHTTCHGRDMLCAEDIFRDSQKFFNTTSNFPNTSRCDRTEMCLWWKVEK